MKTKGQKGFTILELLVGTMAAAILALTIGTMLFYVYKGWTRNMAVAEMEYDAAVAIHALDVAVRGASNVVWNGTTLTVYTPPNVTRVFSTSGVSPQKSLLYGGIKSVDGRLVSFTPSVTGSVVWVTMTLSGIDKFNQDTGVRMGVTNLCIQMRNIP